MKPVLVPVPRARSSWLGAALAALSVTLLVAGCGTPAAGSRPTSPAASGKASSASPSSPATPPGGAGGASGASSSPAASGASPVHLDVLYGTTSAETSPLWIAVRQKMFQRNGLDVTLALARGTLATDAVMTGRAQIAVVSVAEIMPAVVKGARMQMIAYFDRTNPYDIIAGPSIKRPQDLIGKTIAISKLGDTSDLSTHLALVPYGVIPGKNVTELQVGNSPVRYAALISGKVSAAIMDATYAKRAEAHGMHVLVSLAAKKIPYAANGDVITTAWAATHRSAVEAFLRAQLEGVAFFLNPADRTASLAAIAHYEKRSPTSPNVIADYNNYRPKITCAGYPTVDGVQTVVKGEQAMFGSRYDKVKATQLIDPSFMQTLKADGFIARTCGSSGAA